MLGIMNKRNLTVVYNSAGINCISTAYTNGGRWFICQDLCLLDDELKLEIIHAWING